MIADATKVGNQARKARWNRALNTMQITNAGIRKAATNSASPCNNNCASVLGAIDKDTKLSERLKAKTTTVAMTRRDLVTS